MDAVFKKRPLCARFNKKNKKVKKIKKILDKMRVWEYMVIMDCEGIKNQEERKMSGSGKRFSAVTVRTEGAEQVFGLADIGAKRRLTVSGWVRAINRAGYSVTADMIEVG